MPDKTGRYLAAAVVLRGSQKRDATEQRIVASRRGVATGRLADGRPTSYHPPTWPPPDVSRTNPSVMEELQAPLVEGGSMYGEEGAMEMTEFGDDEPLVPSEEVAPPHADATMGWMAVCAIMVSIILGLGVLGLSEAFASLGWVLSYLLLALVACGALYSGYTIYNIVDHVTMATGIRPRTYPALGHAAFGNMGKHIVEITQLVFLGGAICAVHLTAAESLKQVVLAASGDTTELCIVACNAIIAAVVLPVMQARSLKDVTWVAVLGVLTIITPLIIYMTEVGHVATYHACRPWVAAWIMTNPHAPCQQLELSDQGQRPVWGFPAGSGLEAFASKFTTIIFAYQGQTIFPELMGDMRDPKQFPRAIRYSLTFMTLVYATVRS